MWDRASLLLSFLHHFISCHFISCHFIYSSSYIYSSTFITLFISLFVREWNRNGLMIWIQEKRKKKRKEILEMVRMLTARETRERDRKCETEHTVCDFINNNNVVVILNHFCIISFHFMSFHLFFFIYIFKYITLFIREWNRNGLMIWMF